MNTEIKTMRLSKFLVVAAIAALPLQASASAAVVAAAAGAASVAAAAGSSRHGSADEQVPQGVAAAPIEWAVVGWLSCPSQYAKPSGCRETVDAGWMGDKAGDIEPWVDWMKRHKGPSARFMGMTVVKGHVRLFYGVPAE